MLTFCIGAKSTEGINPYSHTKLSAYVKSPLFILKALILL